MQHYCLWFVALLQQLLLITTTDAQDCTGLPSNNFLRLRLQSLLISDGGEGGTLVVTVQDGPFYTCQVQGTTMGTYQELSVILTYITDTDNSPRSRQFELDCISAGGITDWDSRSGSLSSILDASVDYSSLGTFTNCSRCTSSAGNDNHCQGCDAACNVGLMRCTGTTATDCCVAFEDDGVCKEDLNCNENNFVANEQNSFTCACGVSCGDGYMFHSSSCNCTLTDICLADNPCANGVCIPGLAPDQYTCNCTGTNYMGTNCSVPLPAPSSTSQPLTSTNDQSPMDASSVPTPMSTTALLCANCRECNQDNNCCTECDDGYSISGCMCLMVSMLPRPSCTTIRGCSRCSDESCCDQCDDGYMQDSRDPCSCVELNTIITAMSSERPTPTSGARPVTSDGITDGTVAGIIVSSIVGVLMLIVLVVLIVYVIYYYLAGAGTATSKAKKQGPFLQGEAHDNPMYLDPELF